MLEYATATYISASLGMIFNLNILVYLAALPAIVSLFEGFQMIKNRKQMAQKGEKKAAFKFILALSILICYIFLLKYMFKQDVC